MKISDEQEKALADLWVQMFLATATPAQLRKFLQKPRLEPEAKPACNHQLMGYRPGVGPRCRLCNKVFPENKTARQTVDI